VSILKTITLGVHETLELHELMAFKSLCLTKSSTMSGMVEDNELKNLLTQDVTQTKNHIQTLQQFVPRKGQ
jgi:similar to spore coat protein